MKKNFLPVYLFLFFCCAKNSFGESLTLTTYYPAPFGAYDRIQLVPRATAPAGPCQAGTLYVDNTGTVFYCKQTATPWIPFSVWTQVNNSLYTTDTGNPNLNVGIGLQNPTSKLMVRGSGTTNTSSGLQVTNGAGISALFVRDDQKVQIGQTNLNAENMLEVGGNIEIEIPGADSRLRFPNSNSGVWYSMGIDVSDTNKFKINLGNDLGQTDQFSMTTTGDVEIGGSLTVKSNGVNKGQIKLQYVAGAEAGYYATYAP